MSRYHPCVLGIALLTCLACDDGSGSNGAQDAGPGQADATPQADAAPILTGCDGAYVITGTEAHDQSCLERTPMVGEAVRIADGQLHVGDLTLPLTHAPDGCAVQAQGCTVEPALGHHTTISATLDTASGQLRLTPEQITAFRPATCVPTVFTVTPKPSGCVLNGRFEVAEAPTLVGGTCDLSWSAATVSIDTISEVRYLRWGQQRYEIIAMDEAACTVTASGGLAIYNDVARTTQIVAQLTADAATLTISDALEGTSSNNETCVGAQFEATGQRLQPGGDPLNAQCEALPFVCGDGACDLANGEQCENCPEDCGCEGSDCVRLNALGTDDAPVHACASACGNTPCPDAQRCVPAAEFGAFFITGNPRGTICLDALGDTGLGGRCEDSRTCAPDLMCALNRTNDSRCLARCDPSCGECWPLNQEIDLCLPRCHPNGADACGDSVCASQTLNHMCSTEDREQLRWFCHPTQIESACRPEGPAFGEPCADGACGAGGCLKDQCTRDERVSNCDVEVCSRPCQSDDDCAAPLPRCVTIETPNSTTGWCQAG
jgi:hypothetical protein